MNLFMRRPTQEMLGYFKSWKMRTIWKPQCQQDLTVPTVASKPFSSVKWNYFKMELDVDPRIDDDASPTSSEGMKAQLFT